jgi:hypothetical protein
MRKTTLVSGSSKNSILPWAPAIKGNVIISPKGSERFCTNVIYTKFCSTDHWCGLHYSESHTGNHSCWLLLHDVNRFFWVVISFIPAFARPLLTARADGCIVSISSAARAVAVWPGIVYAGVKGMFWIMIHLLPLVIHQS